MSSFQMKVNFAFHLEIKVPEFGGKVERHRIQIQCEVSAVWVAISAGVGPLSKVNTVVHQEILE